MKSTICSFFVSLALILAIGVGSAYSQTELNEQAQNRVNKILGESGQKFRNALMDFKMNRRSESGDKFDEAIGVFLASTINIQSNDQLRGCYDHLINTIFRLEYPSQQQPPMLRELTVVCGWSQGVKWPVPVTKDQVKIQEFRWASDDFELADAVLKTLRPAANSDNSAITAGKNSVPKTPDQIEALVGFNSQTFEPSPLDELSKLELTQDEQQVEGNPEAQQQYQYIQYAVANRSLGFSFQVHPMIQQYINYYRGRGRTTMEVGLYRSGMFMSMARRIFREEGIPENVAWLGQVESAWKPVAMSHMAASGLWQFIPGTGSRYGLRRTAHVDERNSLEEATRASARYLKFLFNRYGNWELAMAGYNCGEGNVDRAIRRAGVNNFWAAYPYLPRETRNYVPNILATILVANNPGAYGFGHVRPAPALRYDRIRVPASTSLNIIAQAADTTAQYIRYLNPHLRTNMTPPEPYIINVPAGKANEVVAVFKRLPASKVNDTNLAKSVQGETWQTISNRTGVTVDALMAANPGMKSPTGKVFVPMAAGNRVAATTYSRPASSNSATVASNVKVVKAQAGDTVSKLAACYEANATEVAKYNGLLPSSVLGAGREIRLPGPLTSTKCSDDREKAEKERRGGR